LYSTTRKNYCQHASNFGTEASRLAGPNERNTVLNFRVPQKAGNLLTS